MTDWVENRLRLGWEVRLGLVKVCLGSNTDLLMCVLGYKCDLRGNIPCLDWPISSKVDNMVGDTSGLCGIDGNVSISVDSRLYERVDLLIET